MPDLDELTRRFREFGSDAQSGSPLYARLSTSIATEPEVVELLRAAPPTQQIPVLLLAAVHDLVLREPDLELAAWYPSVSDHVRDDDPFPAFAALCDARADELRSVIASRTTQTNEVARCAFYLPVLGVIEHECGPLSLVDVGASAGLNLNFDRYEYRYDPGGTVGAESTVVITSSTRGAPPIPGHMPAVAARIGVDASPVDATDPSAAGWLRACVWPDQAERFERLAAALEIAATHPPTVHRGDAVEDVGGLARDAAGVGHAVVMNSWVLNYLTDGQRVAYVEELDRLGDDLDLTWVFAESPFQCSGLPMPADEHLQHLTVVMLVRWRDGRRTVEHVATAHPHGRWLHWGNAARSFRRGLES